MKIADRFKERLSARKEKKAKNRERERYHKEVLSEEKKRKVNEKASGDAYLSLQHINKIYDNHIQAVYDFNLEVQKNEFIVFVGPSGCGKSTTLRMIAGLEDITSGDLFIDGVYSNVLTPKERDISMVFQSYALFPNMTVYENIAFGLKINHTDKKELDERVRKAAEILQLSDYLDRKPANLSGGQMQRVALGRAIVKNSKLFLMDEPLSNLDAKLRVAMRSEIVDLHNKLGATTIYVTHDQTEAMTMASRIVVMNKGYIQQVGTPKEIYNHPKNRFVATFVGSPAMNLMNAVYEEGKFVLEDGIEIPVSKDYGQLLEVFYRKKIGVERDWLEENRTGTNAVLMEQMAKEKEALITKLDNALSEKKREFILGIRPEGILVSKEAREDAFQRNVIVSELLGSEYYLHFRRKDNSKLIAKASANETYSVNEEVYLRFEPDKINVFDPLTEENIEGMELLS